MKNVWLAHHGILGQKWGVRRYENPDGTLTEAGKKRYAKEVQRNHQKSKKNRVDDDDLLDPDKWVEQDRRGAKNLADNARNLTRSLQDLERATDRSSKKNKKMDLSEMSDKELRDAINRELLERQYNQVFNPPTVSKGRQFVKDALETTGAVLGVASSALAIALAMQQLRNGSG